MVQYSTKTAVAFFVFNRPETTLRVFEQIRSVRPTQLFLVADGPREGVLDDADRCRAVRDIVAQVDWPCEVLTDYADANLGCRRRVSTGLDWVFANVPEAIILEDDCLPDQTFFRFCDELLDRYRDDERVMLVAGTNSLFGADAAASSYYFSSFGQLWGWAAWRRTWTYYDVDMKIWPRMRAAGWLAQLFSDRGMRRYWELIFEMSFRGLIKTWDYQLIFSSMVQNGLTVVPQSNLVTNIGFGSDATSTRMEHRFANIPITPIEFPLKHPSVIARDCSKELVSARNVYFRPLLPLMLSILLYRLRRWRLGS